MVRLDHRLSKENGNKPSLLQTSRSILWKQYTNEDKTEFNRYHFWDFMSQMKIVNWIITAKHDYKVRFLKKLQFQKTVIWILLANGESRGYQMFLKERLKGQANKGAGRMPWHWEPMKDVISCDKLRGDANNLWSGDFWMRKLTWVHTQVHYTERNNRCNEGTAWTETSK